MSLSVLGINHKTADVSFREKLAFNPERLTQAYESLNQRGHSDQNLIILSTCNRTEIYFYAIELDDVLQWLSSFLSIKSSIISDHAYHHQSEEAIAHMIRVASGLDSMILGEPQILGQFKDAITNANKHQQLNKKFVWLLEQIIASTKNVRHESKVGEQAVSLAFAVSKLALQIFENLHKKTLLLVAIGEMNQLVAKNLSKHGIEKIIIANRTQAKAHEFAATLTEQYNVDVEVIAFAELEHSLHLSDVVCSCTASMDYVIHYKWVKKAIKQRKYKPILMIDLAVPRDIDTKVSSIDDVYDYSVDDLQQVVTENIEKRKSSALHAQVLVSQEVANIKTKQRLNDVGYLLAQYQKHMQSMAAKLCEKAEQKIDQGESPKEVMQLLTKQLTSKLTHTQFHLLKEAASLKDSQVLDFMVEKLPKQDS